MVECTRNTSWMKRVSRLRTLNLSPKNKEGKQCIFWIWKFFKVLLDGVSQIRMYDKRDRMETLKQYRRYPLIETRLSEKCLYATLHCQLCRFAIWCLEIHLFQEAAAKSMTDMIRHGYAKDRLRSKLQNFRKTFFPKLTDEVDYYWSAWPGCT